MAARPDIRREIAAVAWRGQPSRQRFVAREAAATSPVAALAPTPTPKPSVLVLDERLAQGLAPYSAEAAAPSSAEAAAPSSLGSGSWDPAASVPATDTFSRFEKAMIKADTPSLEAAAARIAQLERMLRAQELEVRVREAESADQADEIRRLRAQNIAMHDFLADYSIQWVGGDRISRPTSSGSTSRPVSGRRAVAPTSAAGPAATASVAATASLPPGSPRVTSSGLPCAPSMDRVRAAVLELNELAGGAGTVVKRADGLHGLRTLVLPLVFWKDGFQVDSGPVRTYGSPECAAFLRDLLDGFFPYELKHAFPDGVPFGVADRTDRRHADAEGEPKEWGCGRVLDSCGDSRVVQMGAIEQQHDSGGSRAAAVGAHGMSVAGARGPSEREARAAAMVRAVEARLARS